MNQDNGITFIPYPVNPDGRRIRLFRLLILIGGIILVAILIGLPLYRYLADGRIVVYTNNPQNVISLRRALYQNTGDAVDTYVQPLILKSGRSVSLAPGLYTLSVSGNGSAVSQNVSIKSSQSARYTINPARLGEIETVADANSQALSVDSSRLIYLDGSTQNLYQVDNQNKLSKINGSVLFTDVRWVDSSLGVGRDGSGKFYAINNGNVAPLSTPINGGQVIFAIAPNHTIYLANGQGIYAGTASGGFKKIYGSNQSPLAIVASDQRLALIYNSGEGPVKDSVEKVLVLKTDGSLLAQKSIGALAGWWSPSGKYLLLSNDSYTQIFDDTLSLAASLPSDNIGGPVWLDDTTLLYSINNQLWEYRLSSGISQELATTAKNHDIENIVLNKDASFVYLSVQSTVNSANDLIIERFGLHGQIVPSFIYTLQKSLPQLSGRCLMYFTNFTSPTVQIYDSHLEDNCQQVAKSFVINLGIDPSKIQYSLTNTPPDEPGR